MALSGGAFAINFSAINIQPINPQPVSPLSHDRKAEDTGSGEKAGPPGAAALGARQHPQRMGKSLRSLGARERILASITSGVERWLHHRDVVYAHQRRMDSAATQMQSVFRGQQQRKGTHAGGAGNGDSTVQSTNMMSFSNSNRTQASPVFVFASSSSANKATPHKSPQMGMHY